MRLKGNTTVDAGARFIWALKARHLRRDKIGELMAIHLHKNDLPDDVKFTGSVAIDTETLGLKPLRDRLCLVQFLLAMAKFTLFSLKWAIMKHRI